MGDDALPYMLITWADAIPASVTLSQPEMCSAEKFRRAETMFT